MTTEARAGVGATFEYDSGGGFDYVADLVSMSGPELSVDEVDATSLDSVGGYKEFVPGSLDGGTVTLTLNFSNETQQRDLRGLVGSIDVSAFRMTLPTDTPAVITFSGNVVGFSQSTEPNAPMTADVSIKLSGSPAWGEPTHWAIFGAGGTRDRISVTTTAGGGLLVSADHLRGVMFVRFDGTNASGQTLLHIGVGASTSRFRIVRNTASQIGFTLGDATQVNTVATFANGADIIALLFGWDLDTVSGTLDIYRNGTHVETLSVTLGTNPALSACTELSIGAAISSFTNADNLFLNGASSEVRLWLTDDSEPIRLRRPVQAGGLISTIVSTTEFINSSRADQLYVGASVEFIDSTATPVGTATVTAINVAGNPQRYTVGSPITGLTAGDSTMVYTTQAGAHIADVLASAPGGGSIAGIDPEVYFGGGQASTGWSNGENRGLWADFDHVGTID